MWQREGSNASLASAKTVDRSLRKTEHGRDTAQKPARGKRGTSDTREEDKIMCEYCMQEWPDDQIVWDHFKPRCSITASDRFCLLVRCCFWCNSSKGYKIFRTIQEVRAHVRKQGARKYWTPPIKLHHQPAKRRRSYRKWHRKVYA